MENSINNLPITNKEKQTTSLVDRLAENILERIKSGLTDTGGKLPSVRKLAAEMSVSAETAFRAYDKLVALGFIEARRGSGFYIKRRIGNVYSSPRKTAKFDEYTSDWQSLLEPFRPYHNDISCGYFPDEWQGRLEINNAIRAISQVSPSYLYQYQESLGYMPLRQQISLKLEENGIQATPEQIMLTYGATDAIHIAVWSHFFQGQYVVRESPCSFIHTQRLLASGVEIVDVPRGVDGPDTDKLEEICHKYKPRAFLCSSLLQNPTSSSIAPHVAYKILKLADEYDFFIIDDDTYGDLQPPALHNATRLATLDQLNRVIHIGSFSKTLSPGLRVGYIAANPRQIAMMNLYKSVGSIAGNQISERIVYRIISDGKYRHHCTQIRAKLDEYREQLRDILSEMGFEIMPSIAGMYLWATVPYGAKSDILYKKLMDKNIRIATGRVFCTSSSHEANTKIRFNIASATNSPALKILKDFLG